MSAEPGTPAAAGLPFWPVLQEVVLRPKETEVLDSAGSHPGERLEGEVEELPPCKEERPKAAPFRKSGWGNSQVPGPAPWDDAKVFLPPLKGEAYPSGESLNPFLPGLHGETTHSWVESRGGCEDMGEQPSERDAVAAETQRQNFRQFRYRGEEGPRQACSQLWYLCHRWLKPERHTKEQILELLILEQFLAILPVEVQSWVKRQCPETCSQAVALAEDFLQRPRDVAREGGQVGFEETPMNSLEAQRTSLGAGEKRSDEEIKQEGSGGASCTEDEQPSEMENLQLNTLESAEPCERVTRRELPPLMEKKVSLEQPGGRELGKDPEERVACGEGSNNLTESTNQQKNPPKKGKQETTCSVCGKSFSRRTGLLAHERVHTGEKPYKCSHCGRSFRSKSTLVVHQRTHTGEKPYQCQECGKSFPVTTQLIEHERTHSGEKPYKCAECGQTFRQRSHLKNHQKIHTGIKPFKCSYCGKGFSISSDLIRHERAHTGEKPYQCPDCGKRFCNSSQVITHRRVHTGEKPYKCLECGKGFTVSQQLIRHQAVHTGEKPYQCLECGKTFGVITLLTGHLRIHTGEKPYECSECGKCFRLRSTLITHLKIHTARKT